MSVAILILGAVLIVAGLVSIFTAPKPVRNPDPNAAGTESVLGDLKEVIEQLNTLLDKFDQRLRLGVLLITLGVGLVGLAGYLEAKDAKDSSGDSAAAVAFVVRAR